MLIYRWFWARECRPKMVMNDNAYFVILAQPDIGKPICVAMAIEGSDKKKIACKWQKVDDNKNFEENLFMLSHL